VSAAQYGPPQSSAVQHYVIVTGRNRAASGLARRTYAEAGPVDETLRKDLTWRPDSAIVEWEYGDLSEELIKVSEQEADNLMQAFRSRWTRTS
jgi:undecaprenyl pyrophosphate synthase